MMTDVGSKARCGSLVSSANELSTTSVGASAERAPGPWSASAATSAAATALEKTEVARMVERCRSRGNAQLAVDRLRVAVNCVVREVELATDVTLREAAAEHAQDHEL